MTDTTNLLGASAPAEQDAPVAATRTRRRATSGGLAALVLPELQAMAGELGISGVGRLRKSQLIEAIQARQAGAATTSTADAGASGDSPAKAAVAPATGPSGTAATAELDAETGAVTKAAVTNAAVTNGAVTNGAVTRGAATKGAVSDGAVSDGAVSDGAVSTFAGSNGAVTDTAVTDGAVTNRAVTHGAARGRGAHDGDAPAGASDAPASSGATSSGATSSGASSSGASSSGASSSSPVADAGSRVDTGGPVARGDDDTDGDGERPERVDRGRERFLEREARRQERLAQGDGAADGGDPPRAPRSDRADRQQGDGPARQDRAPQDRQSQDRQPQDRQPQDRQRLDRQRQDRQPQDRQSQDRQPLDRQSLDRQSQDRQQAPYGDDDDGTGRRGRFRERGRGRTRSTGRTDRFVPGDADPVLSDDDVLVPVGGILDILENYAFVRTTGYLTGPSDVYVSLQQVRKYGLRRGDAVTGAVRQQREGQARDKYNALVRLDSVNGLDPAEAHNRPDFTKLTPLYPQDRLRLETEPGILTTRVIDLVMPVGKGQRALIVSPPKAGKTMVMQAIANAITTNNPECHLMVVLVDERPEEVTDMQRSVKGEVIASTFDRPPQDHITVAELSIERAKRLVELGHDVVVLLDSITRLGRAYNLGAPASGRILTGGVDSAALYPPKRFLGAARNIENGGSLTIFATALVETGSAMDTVIFEEFKGTGNAELKLDRRLADKRIFPAIDVDASGTRKEEILLSPEELRIVLSLRRVLHALDATQSLELLLDKMKATRTNVEFLMQIQKTTAQD